MRSPRSVLAVLVALGAALAGCSAPESDLDRARRALDDGRDQDAYAIAEALTEGEGADAAEAWIVLSRAARRTWRSERASVAARRATELVPDDAAAHLALARAELFRAQPAAAVEAARRATELAPENALAHAALGEALLGRKNVATPDFPAAEEALRRAVELRPDDPRLRQLLARALVGAGHHAEGKAELDRVIAAQPFAGPAFALRGMAHLRMREFHAAEEDLMQATALDPHSSETLFALARAFHLQGNKKDAETARARYRWVSAMEGGIEGFALRYHTDPENPLSAQELIQALLAARRFHEAFAIAETFCRDHPRRPAGLFLLTEAALGVGDTVRAVEAAARAVELMPGNVEGHLLAARAYAAAGEAEPALEAARAAASLESGNPEVTITLAERLLDAGHAEEAARRFDEAMRADGSRVAAVAGRGLAAAAMGDAAQAETMLSRALQARPRRASWLVARGRARREQGKVRGAEQDFRTAIRFAPAEPEAYGELAALLRDAGRDEQAEEMRRNAPGEDGAHREDRQGGGGGPPHAARRGVGGEARHAAAGRGPRDGRPAAGGARAPVRGGA